MPLASAAFAATFVLLTSFAVRRVHRRRRGVLLGFLILMGTVVNNPILIVHQAMVNLREQGMSALDAVTDAVDTRLRPIAMSTLTTVCGLAPLVLLPGEGTELYRGVGVIVLFGLLGTAFVTLTFLPALTVMILGWREPRRQGEDVPDRAA